MKRTTALLLILLASIAESFATGPSISFYPGPGIDRLVYQVLYLHPSNTVSGRMDTTSEYVSDLGIIRDPAVDGIIINHRDSGTSPSGIVDSKFMDTCRINANQIDCKHSPYLFLNDPRARYPNEGGYYALGDSVYFSIKDSTPAISGLPGLWGSASSGYYLKDVGLRYERDWSGLASQTEITSLRQINDVPIPGFDGSRLKDAYVIGIKNGTKRRQPMRTGVGVFRKFILDQYLLGRRLGPG